MAWQAELDATIGLVILMLHSFQLPLISMLGILLQMKTATVPHKSKHAQARLRQDSSHGCFDGMSPRNQYDLRAG